MLQQLSSRERFLLLLAVDRMAMFYDSAAARAHPSTQERKDMDNAAEAARELSSRLLGSPMPVTISNNDLALSGRAVRMLSGDVLKRIQPSMGDDRKARLRALSSEMAEIDRKTRLARGLPG